MLTNLIDATLSLFAVINSIGSIPLFVQLTAGMEKPARNRTFKVAVLTGIGVRFLFAGILGYLGK